MSAESEEDGLLVTCAGCGVPFEAGPDSFVEVGFVAEEDTGEDDEAFIDPKDLKVSFGDDGGDCIDFEDLMKMNDHDLRALGLDAAARDAISRAEPGDEITTGAQPFCERCQKEMFPE